MDSEVVDMLEQLKSKVTDKVKLREKIGQMADSAGTRLPGMKKLLPVNANNIINVWLTSSL